MPIKGIPIGYLDSRYVNITGDTMTGQLVLQDSLLIDDWLFDIRGASIYLQAQTSGTYLVELFSADGDRGDSGGFRVFRLGNPSSINPSEYFQIIHNTNTAQYEITSEALGTGVLRPIVFDAAGTNVQFVLNTDGTVGIGKDDYLYLGAGYDAGFKYDGTNLVVDPAVVGSGIFKYLAQPTFTDDEQIATKKYVDDSISAGNYVNVVTKTSAYTATTDDDVILCNGTFTITLPTIASADTKVLTVKNIGTGTITVDGDGSETIDEDIDQEVGQYEALKIVADSATGWWVI